MRVHLLECNLLSQRSAASCEIVGDCRLLIKAPPQEKPNSVESIITSKIADFISAIILRVQMKKFTI